MKKILAVISLFLVTLMPLNASAKDRVLYAVKFHADWCGSCKAMAPQIEKARGKYGLDDLNVLFVKLDLTDKTTSNQSKLLASSIGLGEFYKKNNGKTGFMILVNGKTGEILGKITKNHKAEDIATIVKKQVKTL